MLPVDMQREILKYTPQYYRINKQLYDRNLFYNYNCNLPISENELLNYIKTKPYKFVLFYQKMSHYYIDKFVRYDTRLYMRFTYKITREQLDYDEIYIHTSTPKESFIDMIRVISVIDYIYDDDNIVNLDILSMFHILNNRVECIRVNPNYTKEKIKNIVKYYLSFNNIIDIDTFEEWVVSMYYLYYNGLVDITPYVKGVTFNMHDRPNNLDDLYVAISEIQIDYDKIKSNINELFLL